MRLNRLSVPRTESSSFDLRHEFVPYFSNPWHFHPELELNYVVRGTGIRFIGQSVERFEDGEIVLLGKNLSHYWKSDSMYHEQPARRSAEAIIVRFAEDFAGEGFFRMPETTEIRSLFNKARDGLKLTDPLRSVVAGEMKRLLVLQGFEQLIGLFGLLQQIAISDDLELISPDYRPDASLIRYNERLNTVLGYLVGHFTEQVALKDVAALIHMHEAAFCRFFKAHTGTTVTAYLTGLRVRYACDLLVNTSESVTAICFETGFENVSHFIQAFKKHKHLTPFAYRKAVRR